MVPQPDVRCTTDRTNSNTRLGDGMLSARSRGHWEVQSRCWLPCLALHRLNCSLFPLYFLYFWNLAYLLVWSCCVALRRVIILGVVLGEFSTFFLFCNLQFAKSRWFGFEPRPLSISTHHMYFYKQLGQFCWEWDLNVIHRFIVLDVLLSVSFSLVILFYSFSIVCSFYISFNVWIPFSNSIIPPSAGYNITQTVGRHWKGKAW